MSDFDLRGVTAARVRACVLVGYKITPSQLTKVLDHHNRNCELLWKMNRRRTSAAWVIRWSAIHPNNGFGTGWSTCYGAVGGESMPDVGGAVGVGIAGGGEGQC